MSKNKKTATVTAKVAEKVVLPPQPPVEKEILNPVEPVQEKAEPVQEMPTQLPSQPAQPYRPDQSGLKESQNQLSVEQFMARIATVEDANKLFQELLVKGELQSPRATAIEAKRLGRFIDYETN